MEPFPEPARPKKRTGASKYDFFKVKVWLGDTMNHYYVLSRFLICRMLTVTKIPYIKAVKIALETKKYLVDHNLTDVTQAQLESVLFSIIRSKGFDERYIECYRLVTQFYQQRQPLCIVICGTAWTGKSSIAQQLASRINIPNVMQTDVIYELLRASGDSPLQPLPLWCRPHLPDTALVGEFRREARVVRKGLDGDLVKTLSDGKPIIIEGMHLDPDLLIPDFQSSGIIMLPARPPPAPRYLSPVRRPAAAAGDCGALAGPAAAAAAAADAAGDSGGGSDSGSPDRPRGMGRSQSQRPFSASAAAERASRWAAGQGAAARPGPAGAAAAATAGRRAPAAASSSAGAAKQQHQQPKQAGADSWTYDTELALDSGSNTHHQSIDTNTNGFSAPHSFSSNEQQRSAQQCAPAAAAGRPTPFAACGGAGSSPQQQQQQQPAEPCPVLDPAAAAAALEWPLSAADGSSPAVMILGRLTTDAAAAEAAALQQHRQQQQLKQLRQQGREQQQGLFSPVSCCSPDSDGPGGASPSVSQEHSTTEVASRQHSSCGSPALSQEQSAASLASQEPSAPELALPLPLEQQEQQDAAEQRWQQGPSAAGDGAGCCGASSCCCGDTQQQQQQLGQEAAWSQQSSQTRQLQQQQQGAGNACSSSTSSSSKCGMAAAGEGIHAAPAAAAGGASQDQPAAAATLDQAPDACSLLQAGLGRSGGGTAADASAQPQQGPERASLPEAAAGPSYKQQQQQQPPAQPGLASPVAAPAAAVPSSSSSSSSRAAPGTAAGGRAPSAAARDRDRDRDRVLKPLFVPIIVCMDEADHALMAEEALPHHARALAPALAAAADRAGGAAAAAAAAAAADPLSAASGVAAAGNAGCVPGLPVSEGEALRRMRLLQEYLCAYEAQGLPVVRVSYGCFSEALDKLHEYILQCIKVAMESPCSNN